MNAVISTACVLLATILLLADRSIAADKEPPVRIYIGTYTGPQSQGIYQVDLDTMTGKMSEPVLAGRAKNPSFLAAHPNGKFIYAASEIGDFDGKPTGAVEAFSTDPANGQLTSLGAKPSMGGGTCFVSVSPDGHAVLAANYGGGSVVAFGVDPVTGALRQSISYDQHTGHSVNPNRQTRPAAHSIYPTPDGAHALAVDLGTDEIIHYRLDAAAATLTRIGQTLVAPGSGPRHLAFDADGKTVFAIFELTNQIAVYRWEGDSLKLLHTAPTLPADFKGESTTAEVAMAPNQSFVYGSNRGHNSIAVFSYDAASGKLSPVAHTPTQGDGPRHFAIDPTGRFLVVANQKSDSLVAFKIDPTLGTLTPTGSTVKIESPVCVRFALPTRP